MKNLEEFIPIKPLSEEGKERLRKHSETQKKLLKQMREDYENGVYDEFIKTLPENE